MTYRSSYPISLQLLGAPFVDLKEVFSGFFLLEELEQLELDRLAEDAEKVGALSLTLGLSIVPGESVGGYPDTDVLQPVVVLRALLGPVVQVVWAVAPVTHSYQTNYQCCSLAVFSTRIPRTLPFLEESIKENQSARSIGAENGNYGLPIIGMVSI